jgi:hypothetical protein
MADQSFVDRMVSQLRSTYKLRNLFPDAFQFNILHLFYFFNFPEQAAPLVYVCPVIVMLIIWV